MNESLLVLVMMAQIFQVARGLYLIKRKLIKGEKAITPAITIPTPPR